LKPLIGITLGDPAGVGPEVVRAALADPSLPADFDYEVIRDTNDFVPGFPTKESALHALAALEEGTQMALRGEIAALVTGPVSKKALHDVGFDFPGQTEFFAHRSSVENFAMCLTGGKITVALVTAHIPLRQVADELAESEIIRVGLLLADFLAQRGVMHPRIAVAGLNPHAGESGDLGREELELIGPAVEILQRNHPERAIFSGPHSPDTLFHQVVNGSHDGVLCMYHDQGLIPLKLHAFDRGVNVTLGLPFTRTSPDHGTAFDLAGKRLASAESMKAAIKLAVQLSNKK